MIRNLDELGRVVIPKEMRKQLGINKSDQVNIEVVNDKIVISKVGENLKEKVEKQLDKYTDLLDNATAMNTTDAIQCYTGYVEALKWVIKETN